MFALGVQGVGFQTYAYLSKRQNVLIKEFATTSTSSSTQNLINFRLQLRERRGRKGTASKNKTTSVTVAVDLYIYTQLHSISIKSLTRD